MLLNTLFLFICISNINLALSRFLILQLKANWFLVSFSPLVIDNTFKTLFVHVEVKINSLFITCDWICKLAYNL